MSITVQENLPFAVYIIEEVDTPEIPAQLLYRKIGWLTKTDSKQGPYHERTRILNQGNVRGNELVFAIDLPTKEAAKGLEAYVHNELDRLGCTRRGEETNLTGHSEWFKVTLDKAKEVILAAYKVYQETPYLITGVACGTVQHHMFEIPDISQALVDLAAYKARYSASEDTTSAVMDLFSFR